MGYLDYRAIPSTLGPCPLCGRAMLPGPSVNTHHVIPKSKKGRDTVKLHTVCHSKIHSVFTENELRDHYHTMERLRAHPAIASFIAWVQRKAPTYKGRNQATAERRGAKSALQRRKTRS